LKHALQYQSKKCLLEIAIAISARIGLQSAMDSCSMTSIVPDLNQAKIVSPNQV
jgi:hypothetical protein